jgi:hypothetical protein
MDAEVFWYMSASHSQFWDLAERDTAEGLAEWAPDREAERLPCSLNPQQHRLHRYSSELNVLLTSKRFTDFIWTYYSDLMIQDRVLGMFREQGFTGFEVRPVTARMKIRAREPDPCDDTPGVSDRDAGRAQIPVLWELLRRGWGGHAPPESGFRLLERCPDCGYSTYTSSDNPARLVDEAQWDGSDFFMVWPLPLFVFVSDRVARFIQRERLTGARLVPIEQMGVHPHISGASPGRLKLWMPEERARELGEPLGIY